MQRALRPPETDVKVAKLALGRAPHEIERGLIWRMYKWDIDNPRGF